MSGTWDGTSLLAPIAEDRPCGLSLEDTPQLAAFDALRLFGQLTQFMPDVVAPERKERDDDARNERRRPVSPPTWDAVRIQALDALGKSKDLRLLAHLGAAVLRTDGLPAFSTVLTAAATWLESYWDTTYPLVDEDALLRFSALNCFADPMAIVEALRKVPLVADRQHGTYSLRELDVAGFPPPANSPPRPEDAPIVAAFSAIPLENLGRMHGSTVDALAALKRIEAAMNEKAGAEMVPDFSALSAPLGRIERVLQKQVDARTPFAGTVSGEEARVAASEPGQPVPVGVVRSRQDAIRALDAVAEFFRRNEPSSPIPLFLERAKRLVSKDFLAVLADIAPDALPQARAAGGVTDSE